VVTIYTKDRAERLAAAMAGRSHMRVERIIQDAVIMQRQVADGLTVNTAIYARVWRGSTLVMNITYEWFDGKSIIL
jgi:hypothetical protein